VSQTIETRAQPDGRFHVAVNGVLLRDKRGRPRSFGCSMRATVAAAKVVDAQRDLPPGFLRWNRALRGAFLKGLHAFKAGEPRSACPYEDIRKPSGSLSWSRSFQRAWLDGWQWGGK
jgi:hypothetical protein